MKRPSASNASTVVMAGLFRHFASPEEFARFAAEDAEKWAKAVKAAGIRLE